MISPSPLTLTTSTQPSTYELVFLADNIGHIHVVSGRAEILELLASEDVDGDEMDLGVTVLAGLGGAHLDNLAGAALDHDETVLAERRALHGVGGRGASIGALEGVLMLRIASSQHQVTRQQDSENRAQGAIVGQRQDIPKELTCASSAMVEAIGGSGIESKERI